MPPAVQDRFDKRYILEPTSGCWLWEKSRSSEGYGLFWAFGKTRSAHRVAWELYCGKIPDGLFVLHSCDVKSCVNPDHLFLGTHTDNMADMVHKGRQASGDRSSARAHPERRARGDRHGRRTHPERTARGESHGAAKLTEAQVIAIRDDPRSPRIIAQELNVTPETIDQIRRRNTWKHVP